MRTGNSSARCAATAASTADVGDANAAHTPSPVCLNNQPPCASIARRSTSSCAASAARMLSASASHRRVEPSTSVNKNVTTPEGAVAAGADTPAQCHNRYAATLHIAGIGAVSGYASYETDFRESQMWSFSRPGTRCGSTNEDMLSAVILRPFRRRPTARFPIFTAKTIGRLSSSTFFRAAKITTGDSR